jgi:hypothetical protein
MLKRNRMVIAAPWAHFLLGIIGFESRYLLIHFLDC